MATRRWCAGVVVLMMLEASGRAAPPEHSSGQGRQLIGQRNADGASVVWFPKQGWRDRAGALDEVYVQGGQLFARRPSTSNPEPLAEGATVTAKDTRGNVVRYRVTKINAPPPRFAAKVSYYTLVNPDRNDEPYCNAAPNVWMDDVPYSSDGDRGLQAVPVAEVWNRAGTIGVNTAHFTMACMSGAIAKCHRWGYRTGTPGITAAHVQACTRMAMADYCGNGESHTVEGTPIRMFDLQPTPGQHPLTKKLPEHGFETAWTGGTAPRDLEDWNDLHDTAAAGGALCLTKKRWETIAVKTAVDPRCPRLADPRMYPNQEMKYYRQDDFFRTRPCDYVHDGVVEPVALVANHALIANTSDFHDDLLSMWTSGAGDRWSTSHLLDTGPVVGQVRKKVPDTFDTGGYTTPSQPLGAVFRVSKLPLSLQDSLGAVPLKPLRTYRTRQGDSVTTTGEVSGAGKLEGYVYPCQASPPDGSIPLYRYVHAQDSETTITPPTAATQPILAPPQDNCARGVEGYLPRFPSL